MKQRFERVGQLLLSLVRPWRAKGVQQLITYMPRVLQFVRPYWKFTLMAVVMSTLVTLVSLLAPWPMKFLIDSVLGNEPLPASIAGRLGGIEENRVTLLLLVVVAQLLLTVVVNGLSVVSNYATTRLDLGMTLDFRSALFQRAQRLSLAFHDSRRAGKLMYVVNQMDTVPTQMLMTILPLGQNILTLGGMFWITFRLDPQLALLSLTAYSGHRDRSVRSS